MIAAGQSIGNYRILQKIGTGGMGAVYLAEHPLIGKKVALKVIHRQLANNKEVVSRFFQEARAVNKIGNEHIVEIHDFGVTPENDHFYIMEYLDGKTLASVMSEEPAMEIMRALHVGAQIASALAAAHAAGVIHRDLKPDNIMLTARLGDPNFVKVLDFGLAKIFADASAVQTAAGVLLGTPQYMSPEACEGRGGTDHRTDVYALGVLLFQMMTGTLPFDGETMGEVLIKQVTMLPPAPRALNALIPPSVEQIILRCLAKRVEGRFATMTALRDALLAPDAYLRQSPPMQPARSVGPGQMGFDAKAVVAHAAAQQQGSGVALPLPAPNPSIAQPRPRSVSAQQQTMLAASPPLPRAPTAVPGLVAPESPKMNTMVIATPLGYTSRPPRRVWPVVLVIGLLVGLGGGAFAVAWFGHDEVAATTIDAASPRGSAIVAGSAKLDVTAGSDIPAGSARGSAISGGSGSAVPVRRAKLAIDSIPEGAEVFVAGQRLGKTPFKVELDVGTVPVEFEFRLAGYKRKVKPMVVGGNTSMSLELERTPPNPTNRPTPGSATPGKGSDDGLMRPGD